MTRLVLALVAAGMAAGTWQDAPGARQPGRLLRIDAVAVDGDERPVTDLAASDLELSIESYRVPVERLTLVAPGRADGGGRLVVLLLDDTIVPLALTPRVREAARRFVNRMVPGDRMAIVSLNGDRMEITDDRSRLLRTIEAYSVRAAPPTRIDVIGEHLLETVAELSRQIAEESAGRKTIVGIGAGWVFDTPIPAAVQGRELRAEWTDAMRATAFARATLYAVDPGGIGTSRFGGSDGFARMTGGHAFLNTNDLEGAVDRIMREAGSYYEIEIADPPVGRKFDLRKLEVKALRRGVTMRARRLIPGTETAK